MSLASKQLLVQQKHAALMLAKRERIAMLKEIRTAYEALEDYDYVRELNVRIRTTENQLRAMKT